LVLKKGERSEQKTGGRFHALTVIAGEIELPSVGILKAGHSAFVPADTGVYTIATASGATVLKSMVPNL
jgi:mannose-6-phosphate isomerase class I